MDAMDAVVVKSTEILNGEVILTDKSDTVKVDMLEMVRTLQNNVRSRKDMASMVKLENGVLWISYSGLITVLVAVPAMHEPLDAALPEALQEKIDSWSREEG